MRVLVIGGDTNIFRKDSESFRRIRGYADLFDELHIIVFTSRGYKLEAFNGRLFLYPTNSFFPIFRWWDAFRKAVKIARDCKIDLIDAENPGEAGLGSYLTSRLTGKPFRIQIHMDIFSPWYRRASWKERIRFWLARFLIPRADCIRVVSERIKDSILRKSNFRWEVRLPKISVLPIFTDISRFLQAEPDQVINEKFKNYEFKMISVGRFLDKEKNFSMLIEMMRDFVKICPRALLVLVGDGPDKETYNLQLTTYNLQNNVKIEEWRDDLPSFYKAFDVFLLSSNYEGWGRAVVEAMASGLLVVMTDVGLAGEVVKDGQNGVIVPVGNKPLFYEAVEDLYRNGGKRRILASAAQDTVQKLHPRTKEEYLNLYKEGYVICLR